MQLKNLKMCEFSTGFVLVPYCSVQLMQYQVFGILKSNTMKKKTNISRTYSRLRLPLPIPIPDGAGRFK